jgi:epidermal growth factor receptor substrate 15
VLESTEPFGALALVSASDSASASASASVSVSVSASASVSVSVSVSDSVPDSVPASVSVSAAAPAYTPGTRQVSPPTVVRSAATGSSKAHPVNDAQASASFGVNRTMPPANS